MKNWKKIGRVAQSVAKKIELRVRRTKPKERTINIVIQKEEVEPRVIEIDVHRKSDEWAQ